MSSPPSIAILALILLLTIGRITVVLNQDPAQAGDSGWYLDKSAYIVEHKKLPAVDHKPYGFSLYLSALTVLGVKDIVAFQTRAQGVMDSILVTTLLLFVLLSPTKNPWLKIGLSIMILFQPFTVTLANVLLTEPMLSFIVFGACMLFGTGFRLTHRQLGRFLLLTHALLLGIAALIRSEMIVVTALVLPLSFLLMNRRLATPLSLRWLLLLAAVASAPVFAYSAAQFSATRQFSYVEARYPWAGYYAWLRTWVVLEKSHYSKFAFGIQADDWAGKNVENYPEWTFDSPAEKHLVAELTRRIAAAGYTVEVDRDFQAVADAKARNNLLRTYFYLPLARGVHFFVNLEGSEFFLPSPWLPKPVRYVVIGLVFASKICFIGLALLGVRLLFSNPSRLEGDLLPYATFAAAMVFVRWSLLVASSPFLFAGLMESRYVYVLWPMILLLAIAPLWRTRSRA